MSKNNSENLIYLWTDLQKTWEDIEDYDPCHMILFKFDMGEFVAGSTLRSRKFINIRKRRFDSSERL